MSPERIWRNTFLANAGLAGERKLPGFKGSRTERGISLSAILVHLVDVFPLSPFLLLTTVMTPNG